MNKELTYGQKADLSVRELIHDFECQPILFIGSGFSRRYFDAPDWHSLLRAVLEKVSSDTSKYDYFHQKYSGDPIEIGSNIAQIVFEWAWSDGRSYFPDELFDISRPADSFLKYMCCEHIRTITPSMDKVSPAFIEELKLLASVRPHAIITTNYDHFLETIFEGYEPISGQAILKYSGHSFGEIYHIHGDINSPEKIVLTHNDYEEWNDKKKYVSAKLLTYFAEHPVFIFGYGLNDPNVREVIHDIGKIIADEDGLINNVYQVVYRPDIDPDDAPDRTVITRDGKEIWIRSIYTSQYDWIFKALKTNSELTSINPKLVRALAARTMKLVRHDIPSGEVQVDYKILEQVSDHDEALPKLLGISVLDNPNKTHPFTSTQMGKRLGFQGWHGFNKLINQIKEDKKIDIRSTDNKYHCQIKTGASIKSRTRKWSYEALTLCERVRDGKDYTVSI